MVTFTLDGQKIEVDAGSTILSAARALAIDIPTFCYQKRLSISASCRMCLVEVEGRNKLEPACATTVAPDMVVHSRSDKVVATRQDMLEMLLANHPLDCPVCDKGGECELQDTVFEYGKGDSRLRDPKRVFRQHDIGLNKVIVFNANRCIQCQRCVRICEEVVGDVALGTAERGLDSEITGVGNSLKDCSHCGNCIEVCPVGALMSVPYRYQARPWDLQKSETICGFCGTGCSLTAELREGAFKRVKSDYDTGINGELLCAKGRFGFDAIDGGSRIRAPMIRKNGQLVVVSWDEAIGFIADQAAAVLAKKGHIQGLISPRQTNETAFMFQHLMRQVFCSEDIQSSTRFSGLGTSRGVQALARVAAGLVERRPLADAVAADCVFLLGASITEDNPVSGYLLRNAMRDGQKKLIIASPRPCGLDEIAHVSLRLLPGQEAHLLSQLFSPQQPPEIGEWDAFVAGAGPVFDAANSITVLLGSEFLRCATAATCLEWIEYIVMHFRALDKTVNVQFMFDRPNQLGVWDMGCLAGMESGWQPSPAPRRDADAVPDLLFMLGSDPLRSCARGDPTEAAARHTSCLVVQSAYWGETAELASVLLPAPCCGEEAGTMTNNEGRVQEVQAVRPPPDNVILPAEVFNLIAQGMGMGMGMGMGAATASSDPTQVRARIAIEVPDFGRFGASLTPGGSVVADAPPHLAPVPTVPSFVLTTGDSLFQSGQMAARSKCLWGLDNGPYVELNPGADFEPTPGGDLVILTCGTASFTAPLRINRDFAKHIVFVPEYYLTKAKSKLLSCMDYPPTVTVRLHPAS